jgi:hypothetical protein
MIGRPSSDQLLAICLQRLRESLGILYHLLTIGFELRGGHLLKLNSESCYLGVVGAALEHWEDGEVDGLFIPLLEEDHA